MLLPLTRLAMSAYLLYGFGYIVPLLRRDLGIGESTAGLHAIAIAIGTIVTGVTADRLARRFGLSVVAGSAAILLAVASVLVALAPTVVVSLIAALVFGVGGGTILSWVNHQLSTLGGQRARVALARAGLVGMVAGLAAPLAIAALETLGANGRLAMVLPIPLVALVEVVDRRRNAGVETVSETVGASKLEPTARQAGRLPAAYWRTWLVMVLGISLEFGVVYWAASLIALNTGAGTSEATTAAAVFLVGMLLARLALSAGFGTRAPRLRLLSGALAAVVVGALITWQASSIPLAVVGLFIAGAGVGPLYPVTVAFELSLVPDDATAGSARATLGTGVALATVPFLLAVIAEQVGLVTAWPLVAGIALVAIALVLVTRGDAPPIAHHPATP